MRKTLGMIAVVGIVGCLPAMAQNAPPPMGQPNAPMGAQPDTSMASRPAGYGSPYSTRASNIAQSDTRSDIAPKLPQPPSGDDASVKALLQDARAAVQHRQTGAAQEALEQAETRLLTRSVRQSTETEPDRGPVVSSISDARHALANHDIDTCMAAIDRALSGMAGG